MSEQTVTVTVNITMNITVSAEDRNAIDFWTERLLADAGRLESEMAGMTQISIEEQRSEVLQLEPASGMTSRKRERPARMEPQQPHALGQRVLNESLMRERLLLPNVKALRGGAKQKAGTVTDRTILLLLRRRLKRRFPAAFMRQSRLLGQCRGLTARRAGRGFAGAAFRYGSALYKEARSIGPPLRQL